MQEERLEKQVNDYFKLLREFRAEFGAKCMQPIRQGVFTLSEPMKELAVEFKEHHVIYQNNPIDKWCLINTNIKTDINGNIQPIKGLDRTQRIDGTMALLCAYIALRDNKDSYINLNESEEV